MEPTKFPAMISVPAGFDRSNLFKLACAVAALLLVMALGLKLETEFAYRWVQRLGWYWTAGLVIGFGASMFWVIRKETAPWSALRRHWLSSLLALAPLVLLLGHAEPQFRVVYDEPVLAATSLNMHLEREAGAPSRAYVINGNLVIMNSVLDKRPLLFPVLLSFVHDLTGYRLSNAFALNMLIAAALSLLLFHHLRSHFGIGAAAAGLLLFYSLPLFTQVASSGGFDLIHLLLVQLIFILGATYLKRGDPLSLNCFSLSFALLASNRYEALLYAIPATMLVLVGWVRHRRIVLTWPAALAPLLLLPVILLNRFVFEAGNVFKKPDSVVQSPFSLDYFFENFGNAVAFLFDLGHTQPNSPLLALMGVVSAALWLMLIVRALQARKFDRTYDLAGALIGLGVVASTGLMLLYFWGNWTDFVVSRFSLPLHLLFAWAVARTIAEVTTKQRTFWIIGGSIAFYILAYTLPVVVKDSALGNHYPSRDVARQLQFIRQQPNENNLYIGRSQLPAILLGRSGLATSEANRKSENLRLHFGSTFPEIYVFQFVRTVPLTGEETVDTPDVLSDEFLLERVDQVMLAPFLAWRVSKVVGFAPAKSDTATLFPPDKEEAPLSRWARSLP
jgi:hypothetical protein